MPAGFGPRPTVYGRFRVWRNAGVLTALLEGLIAEAARRGRTDLSLVGVDSTTARALKRVFIAVRWPTWGFAIAMYGRDQ